MDRVIPKEKFKEHGYWCDDITFLVCILFKEFPEGLLKAFDDMIGEQDLDAATNILNEGLRLIST